MRGPANDQPFLAPVELERFAPLEAQRHERHRPQSWVSLRVAASSALLAVLRNIAFNKHQDLGRPVDEATIAREMKDTFRKLLLQVLEATTKGDIDMLYEAIEKGEIK